MNKVILGLILAVCVLGMALIMLNEKLNRKPDNDPKPVTEITEPSVLEDNKTEAVVEPQLGKAEKSRPEKTRPAPLPANVKQNLATTEKTVAKPVPSTSTEKPAKPVQPVIDKPAKPAQAELEVPALPPVIDLPQSKPSLMEPTPMRNQEEAKPVATNNSVAKADVTPDHGKKETVSPENREKNAETEKSNTSGNASKQVATAHPERNITKFVVFARDKGATVRLVGSSSLRQYKMNTLSNPDRLVVDIDGKWEVKAPGIPKNQMVSNIRLGKYENYTKVVIDLKTKPKNTKIIFNNDNKTMDIRLD